MNGYDCGAWEPRWCSSIRLHGWQRREMMDGVVTDQRVYKLKFHGSSFLALASSRHPHHDDANMSRGNRTCRTRILARMSGVSAKKLRGNCYRGIDRSYTGTGPTDRPTWRAVEQAAAVVDGRVLGGGAVPDAVDEVLQRRRRLAL